MTHFLSLLTQTIIHFMANFFFAVLKLNASRGKIPFDIEMFCTMCLVTHFLISCSSFLEKMASKCDRLRHAIANTILKGGVATFLTESLLGT